MPAMSASPNLSKDAPGIRPREAHTTPSSETSVARSRFGWSSSATRSPRKEAPIAPSLARPSHPASSGASFVSAPSATGNPTIGSASGTWASAAAQTPATTASAPPSRAASAAQLALMSRRGSAPSPAVGPHVRHGLPTSSRRARPGEAACAASSASRPSVPIRL